MVADLEPDGSATHKLTASFTTRTLEGTGGSLALTINLFGTAATLAMSSTHIQAHADDSSAPLKSTNGFPPGMQ